jgi:L-iditol 2-dehydrogenase
LKGVFHHTPSDVRESLRLIATGQVRIAPLVTHRMRLTELEAALRLMQKGAAIKVAITP